MNQIFLMGLIANRGLRKKYLAFFEEHHITVVLSTMAAGTASNAILDALGLEATEKTVYFALLTRDTWKSLKKELYEKMLDKFGAKEGIPDGQTYYYQYEVPHTSTLAAHFSGDEYTESELNEIRQFAEFVKNKRK